MAVKLMNSAMMPQPGFYRFHPLTRDAFFQRIRRAAETNQLESYIGYQQNADFLTEQTGVHIPVNTNLTTVSDGDVLLIMKLPYRTRTKGEAVNPDEFEYFVAFYTEH